jgi:hypothetical protein
MIKKTGYLWKCYGFTMTHMWVLHLVWYAMTAVGIGMLVFALLGSLLGTVDEKIFYRLLAGSAVVLLASIANILYSQFTITFYRFANDMNEKQKEAPTLKGVGEARNEPSDCTHG